MEKQNLFNIKNFEIENEIFDSLLASGTTRLERIISRGQKSEEGFWYDQDENEWVAVLKGHAVLKFIDGSTVDMTEGDSVIIPSHTKHRVDFTDENTETIWLALFYK